MKLALVQKKLRKKIIKILKEQGFKINPHIQPSGKSKITLKRVQHYPSRYRKI